jgi:hypothetical protein
VSVLIVLETTWHRIKLKKTLDFIKFYIRWQSSAVLLIKNVFIWHVWAFVCRIYKHTEFLMTLPGSHLRCWACGLKTLCAVVLCVIVLLCCVMLCDVLWCVCVFMYLRFLHCYGSVCVFVLVFKYVSWYGTVEYSLKCHRFISLFLFNRMFVPLRMIWLYLFVFFFFLSVVMSCVETVEVWESSSRCRAVPFVGTRATVH